MDTFDKIYPFEPMTEQNSIFDNSFSERPYRFSVLPTWFKVYIILVCLANLISVIGTSIIVTNLDEQVARSWINYIDWYAILSYLTAILSLVSIVLILLEHKKAVVIFICVSGVKLLLAVYSGITVFASGHFTSISFSIPVILLTPVIVMLVRKREEWENAGGDPKEKKPSANQPLVKKT